jgi:hypothetical protein
MFFLDNVFEIKSYLLKKFPQFTDADVDKQFGIPEDFDNL